MALVDYADSDDEEHLVDYSDSDDARDATQTQISNTKAAMPPLPAEFHDMYAADARVSVRDDPSLHQGRKRSTPHVEGNWPSHLYLEWCPPPTESDKLSSLISCLQAQIPNINSSVKSEFGAFLPLHISLSRTLGLLTAQKDAFLQTLTNSIHSAGIRPFRLKFKPGLESINWVANYENTRWFLVLRLERPHRNELKRLLRICNLVSTQHGQPPLYEIPISEFSPPAKRMKIDASQGPNPKKSGGDKAPVPIDDKFHVSIAWTLTPPDQAMLDLTQEIAKTRIQEVEKVHIDVGGIKVKIGNIVTRVELLEKAKVEASILYV